MSETDDEVWLLGQPALQDYLNFVRDTAIGGDRENPARLADEWRAANDYYQELEELESGIADQVECRALDPALEPLAAEVTADPYYRETFDTMPTTIGVVELDRLIAYQKCVTWTFVERVKARIGPQPSPEELFRFCLPLGVHENPVDIRRAGSRRFVFRSHSMDLRYHGTRVFRAEQLHDHNPFGPVAGAVGVVVGFGSNFLNVIRSDGRVLLHDGYHRACALRELGITHAPAIIQTVSRFDELAVIAKRSILNDPDLYFRSARPPLLKDFFDPKIRRVWKTPRIVKVVEVTYEVRDYTLPE